MLAWRRGLGTSYTSLVSSLAPTYNVPPALALAIMNAESSGNPNAVSPQGAQGLFQVMPANDASLGITDPFDPTQNASGGLQLLEQYYNQYGNWTEALEAYNEGPNALNAQLAAGQTPTSAGYASSILTASGLDTSSDSTDTTDSSDTGDSDASGDSGDPLSFLSVAGLPGWLVALGGVGIIVLAVNLT
jgi:hypothetical protein